MTQIVKIKQWSASFIVMKHNYVFRQSIRFRIRRVKTVSNWAKSVVVYEVYKIQIQCWLTLSDGKHEVIFSIVSYDRSLRSSPLFVEAQRNASISSVGMATRTRHYNNDYNKHKVIINDTNITRGL